MKYIAGLILFVLCFLMTVVYTQTTGFYYSSPVDGAKDINPQQAILLKTNSEINFMDTSRILLKGSVSGTIPFKLTLVDHHLICIVPEIEFNYGEQIRLIILPPKEQNTSDGLMEYHLSFTVKESDNLEYLNRFYWDQYQRKMKALTKGTIPDNDLDFTAVKNRHGYPDRFPVPFVINRNNPDPRPLFTNLWGFFIPKFNPHILILDSYGTPLFFKRMTATDFKVLQDGTLTYANFNILNATENYYVIANNQFITQDTILMGHGYHVDPHDILLLDNGHYLLMAYDPQVVDMSEIVDGGNPEAVVIGLVIQEVDKERNVYFQWRSWDHLEITDASDAVNLTGKNIDYVHANAFEFDLDGNLLVSMRHMDEITKINYQTGSVIWRMGLWAKKNQFAFNDTIGWTHQHDIRVLANGNMTIFDNGNMHKPHPYSQAIEYEIDLQSMTATRVWYHAEDTNQFALATGSHRRISEDRSLIGWGTGWPLMASEVSLDGTKHFDMMVPDSVFSYRMAKFDWTHEVFTFNQDTLDFGVYEGSIPDTGNFKVYNKMDDTIRITSAYNHQADFWMTASFPLAIPPDDEISVTVKFQPQSTGEYFDVLTLNYDNADTTERIARQIILKGRTKEINGLEDQATAALLVYPNPANDVLKIKTIMNGNKLVRVYSVKGQLLVEKKLNESAIQMDISEWLPGIYFCNLTNHKETKSVRFIKK